MTVSSIMNKKSSALACLLIGITLFQVMPTYAAPADDEKPEVYYATPKSYTIADIKATGMDNYEQYVLVGLSGLSVGQEVMIPGDEITDALKRYWRQGLFSDVKIIATKLEDGQAWLEVQLSPRPRISEIHFTGMKKTDKEGVENNIGLIVGNQITPNMADRAKTIIKRYYDEKGFKNAGVEVVQQEDPSKPGQVVVNIQVERKDKVKINQIIIDGNYALSDSKITRAMKKTKQMGKLVNILSTKKFVEDEFTKDKLAVIEKYNEYGYRDAVILQDTVYSFDDKSVNIYIHIDEGEKYYHGDIRWVGNTVYSTEQLNNRLMINRGDVYNQKRLMDRLRSSPDEDAIMNLYTDNGYLFFQVDPVEVAVKGDSIDLEIRVMEGRPATINRINISGNDRVYEHVIRRELRMKPGLLFNMSDLKRSIRELAQMGHFDQEKMNNAVRPIPDEEAGTVDIDLNLTPRSNDQIELSAGYGSTGVVGSVSLKFTNFSLRNLLNLGTYKILPQGDGQTFSITGRSNGNYYNSASFSFVEPWLGGKRPNSLSVSGFYSLQSGMSSRYYSSNNSLSSYYSNYGDSYSSSYMTELDPDKYLKMWGGSAGIGGRLNWPDDYFQLYGELSYQHYNLKNWSNFVIENGNCNDLNLNFTLSRKSVDNPIYTRSGSDFSLSAQVTPPYSLLDRESNSDYKKLYDNGDAALYKWIEYYKIKFKSKTFTPLSSNGKLVLMTRFDLGYLGHYTYYKQSPFGQFSVGGDGTTGYSSYYTTETVALRGYENGSLGTANIYQRVGMEFRYPLLMETSTNIYALAFLEGGNVWNESKAWEPLNFKRSAGFGLRIYLPMVGLMGIDWAYGFDKPTSSSSKVGGGQFHFIIGQEF